MIKKCDCKHEYQDKEYNKWKRVHNECTRSNPQQYRCTVCLKVRT